MRLSMDEIVNAICLNLAERQQVRPESVEVVLCFDDDLGFSAETMVHGRERILIEANMKEAIVRYMETEYGRRVFPSQISLVFEEQLEQICADITE